MKKILAPTLLLLGMNAYAQEWQESPEITQLFQEAGLSGTFVLYDPINQRLIGHNHERASTSFVPASTFKVPHTLIGLTVEAVDSVHEVLPYGGEPQPFDVWERDMGLREAIELSNVPIYQALARRIGKEPMQAALRELDYGNAELGEHVDDFWLVGPLEISAIEQVYFLHELAQGALPAPARAQQATRDIILLEQDENWALYGKTGWENAPDPGIGWWVGWVQEGETLYPFALNLDIEKPGDAAKRVELGKASLEILGVPENR